MRNLTQDIRIALRGFRRTPTFAVTVLLILGLGIGASVAMFTIFRAVLMERLPVREPDRIVVAYTYRDPAVEFGLQLSDLKTLAAESRTTAGIAGYGHFGATEMPLVDGDRSLTENRVVVSGNFFDVLGSKPALGRLLRPADDLAGASKVLVLSYANWRRDFGGDSTILGRDLIEPYTQARYKVVGVAPPGLDFPAGAGFWMTAGPEWTGLGIVAVARLAPGATLGAARSELLGIKQRLSPQAHLLGARLTAFPQALLGDVRPTLIVLMAAVALLLVIACVNVGNLLLLRAGHRARELATRRALGATRWQIVRQLLIESGLLGMGGGVLGVLCAEILMRLLLNAAPTQLPRLDVVGLAGVPIAAAASVTIVVVLLFGVIPALAAARGDVATTLRLDVRSGSDSTRRVRFRQLLAAAQTALALVMLAGAVLLGSSLSRLEAIPLGYEPDHLAIVMVSWPAMKYKTADSVLYPIGEQLTQRWRAIPGVAAVTPIVCAPMHGPNVCAAPLSIEGETPTEGDVRPLIPIETGGVDFLRVFGIPLRRGRGFTDADREDAPLVAIVSESIARRFWPNSDPIGKRIRYWSDTTTWRTIIGVAGDVRLRALRESTPGIYVPWRQINFWQGTFAVRTSGALASVLPAMRREARAVDPQLNLWSAHPMDDLLAAPLARPRMTAMVMSAFGVAALALAALGMYGLMATMVSEQTRAIGIRMALGATPGRLRRQVLLQALVVSGWGGAVGVAIALASSRLLTRVLFEVSPTDPLAVLGACGVLLSVAVIAAYVPAHRASRIDPAQALRAD